MANFVRVLFAMFGFASLVGACKPKGIIPPASSTATVAVETVLSAGGPEDKLQPGLWAQPLVTPGGLVISHCEGHQADVRLEKKTSTGWVSTVVDAKGAVGKYIRSAIGPQGVELVYLDQDRKTLRHAVQKGDAWDIVDMGSDTNEIGISSQLVVGANGQRSYIHYNVRNELVLWRAGADRAWVFQPVATAGTVWQVSPGLRLAKNGDLLLSFADWQVNRGSLIVARAPAGEKVVSPGLRDSYTGDDEDIAGFKSQWLDDDTLIYMSSRGGKLYRAKVGPKALLERQLLATNVANFAAVKTPQRTFVLIQSGLDDGLGEGVVELAVESNSQWERILVDGRRSVGLHLGVAAQGDVLHAVYHDETRRALRYFTYR